MKLHTAATRPQLLRTSEDRDAYPDLRTVGDFHGMAMRLSVLQLLSSIIQALPEGKLCEVVHFDAGEASAGKASIKAHASVIDKVHLLDTCLLNKR